jgi:MFS family permease
MNEFQVGRGPVTWVGSAAMAIGSGFNAISGPIADHLDARIQISIASVVLFVGFFVSSWVENLTTLYFTYILIGIAASLSFMAAVASVFLNIYYFSNSYQSFIFFIHPKVVRHFKDDKAMPVALSLCTTGAAFGINI